MTPTAMDNLVDTLIEDENWQKIGLDALAQGACAATLKHLNIDASLFEISLLGCDDARIMVLNQDFREKAKPTNVLSWPTTDLSGPTPGDTPELPVPGTPEMRGELGDIAIAYQTCAQEAAQAGHQIAAHVTHLLVHGTLHLLGYDHISSKDAGLMEGHEVQILASLGHPDPYKDY